VTRVHDTNWFDDLVHDTVILHTRDDRSFKGVVAAVHADSVILQDAFLLDPDAQDMLNGLVGVPRSNLSFVQRLSA
jgi:hypothetical protein